MTALHAAFSAYLTGIATLLLLDYADRVRLEPLVRAVWTALTRRYRYTGRHWAVGLSTMQLVDEARALRAACTEDTGVLFFFDEESDVGPYQPKAGVARYNHLSPDELAWRAEHEQRALELGVDLGALRAPVPA